jgi:hypothetical protein
VPFSICPIHAERDLGDSLSLSLHSYGTVKTVMVPFAPRVSSGNFVNIREVMIFIAKHALHHHKSFD